MNAEKIYKEVKTAFCSLMDFKMRGESLEIVTPFCTVNDKFISLFITEKKGKIIVSDGGWVESGMYGVDFNEAAELTLNRIFIDLQRQYSILTVEDRKQLCYYYKVADNLQNLPAVVFDMSNFVQSLVNSYAYSLADKKEREEKQRFNKITNDYLRSKFDLVKFNRTLDDKKNARFNAIITSKQQKLSLITYITGSTYLYFNSDIQRSIALFLVANKSKMRTQVANMIAIVNDKAPGFIPSKSNDYLELLNERATVPFITFTRREEILKVI